MSKTENKIIKLYKYILKCSCNNNGKLECSSYDAEERLHTYKIRDRNCIDRVIYKSMVNKVRHELDYEVYLNEDNIVKAVKLITDKIEEEKERLKDNIKYRDYLIKMAEINVKFNKREIQLIEDIQSAESYVSGDNDLEMDFYNGGWYAHEYNGYESRPLDSYSTDPLITENEIEEENVNECAVFDYCNVYYC